MAKSSPPPTPSPDENFGFFKSPTFFFSAIANKQTHASSSQLRKDFGIGIVEWRCMAMLSLEESVSAARICQVGGMNKSLVSKALNKLQQLNYVEPTSSAGTQKPVLLKLTTAGQTLFQKMLKRAFIAETESTKGLSQEEQHELLRMLKIIYNNIEGL